MSHESQQLEITHRLSEGTKRFLRELALELTHRSGVDYDILMAVQNLDRKVNQFMATQEERLQAIATKIDEVLSDLAALKANNPQIEDEISAIEQKLSITQPTTDTTGIITGDAPNP